MIVACQVIDPGSIPGERILFSFFHRKQHEAVNRQPEKNTERKKKIKKNVENQGIDPCASCMLSMRSTI
jgi:hypothetical protein